jgi:crotonobetainyl-CoA:carnitine CoA-transferase CaiB-like acyl-CoA transferase
MNVPPDPRETLAALWRAAGQPAAALEALALTGADPVLPSSFAVGTVAQATIAAAALAAAELWRLRTGRQQGVSVAMRDAAIEFRSEHYLRIDGAPAPELWDAIAGLYRCGDGRWVRLHTNFPHHRDGLLALLGCDYDRASVQRALARWRGEALETAAAEAGLVATTCRSFAEWDTHPQARAIARAPLWTMEKIGEAPAEPLRADLRPLADTRPLAGVRVLELARVIAGPVCGRTLAAHGADVLLVTATHLPSIEALVIDNGRGKLSTSIDLREVSGRKALAELMSTADIVVQGYRPGAIAGFGFGPEEAAQIRPGIIYVSLSAYGREGPWRTRHGFDSLVQAASGFNAAEAEAFGAKEPKALPCQAIDHATGHLMAFLAMTALRRRASEGGSWLVQASLAQTGYWVRRLGRIDGAACPDPTFEKIRDRLDEGVSGFGRLTSVRHGAVMTETPPHWTRPSVPLGSDPPQWPDRA